MRRAIAISGLLGGILATLLVVFHGWTVGSTSRNVLFLVLAGLILGAVAGPEAEPQAFRFPTLWQMFFAVLGCLVVAFAWGSPPEGYALAAVGGALLGYTAPFWIKFINP